MKILSLIVKEIVHRKLNFLLSVLAIVMAAGLFVFCWTTGAASHRETVKLMLGSGFSLRIVPQDTNMNQFWLTHFSEHTMPEEYTQRLAEQKNFTINHLRASLTRMITFRGQEVLLTGTAAEIYPPGKMPNAYAVEAGTAVVGYQVGQGWGITKGDVLEIEGRKLTVEYCLRETGAPEGDDARIYCNIRDAQEILNLPGRINEIEAIDCICQVAQSETRAQTLERLRAELLKVMPQAQVLQWNKIADMRHDQRKMVRRFVNAIILPSVMVVGVVWVGVLAFLNVRERRVEIGILRALGYNGGWVALLFLGKALIIGLAGAAAGFILGNDLALRFGPAIFPETALSIRPMYHLLYWSLMAAPALSALAGFIPAMFAVTQDPAAILRQE